jgi:hypothetical protein
MNEAPSVAALVRRLAETPADFLRMPREGKSGGVYVDAVVADLMEDFGWVPADPDLASFTSTAASEKRRLRLTLIASWLLHDPWFLQQKMLAHPAYLFLRDGLRELASLVDPEKFVADPDRREELVRSCIAALGLVPEGETEQQAQDRLSSLSTAQRVELIAQTAKAEKRRREIQEAMRKKAAEEAAAAYGRE